MLSEAVIPFQMLSCMLVLLGMSTPITWEEGHGFDGMSDDLTELPSELIALV